MGRRALACLAVLAVGGCGGGAAKPRQAPSEHAVHASALRLTPAVARRLESGFRAQITDSGVPGAVAAIVFPDGREWTSTQGLAVLHPARPMTTRTAFALDGITTMTTAALALKLAEEGRLSLDDPIRRWYPAWHGDRAATVGDLLGHTAGAQDPPGTFWGPILAHPTRATTVRQYLAAAPRPGPRTHDGAYSNAGIAIAGLILERAGGAPLATLMRRGLFGHPGGDGLALQPAERARTPLAHAYWYPHGVSHPVDATGAGAFVSTRAFVGAVGAAGALAGDVPSLARWAHELFGGRVLRPASLAEMTRFHSIPYADGYGLGVAKRSVDGHAMWGHDGDGIGSHTELWHLPRENLTVAASWNDDLIDGDSPILRTLVRGALGTIGG